MEITGGVVAVVRSRRELIIENAVLRHQLNVVRRGSKRPKLNRVDRLKLLIGTNTYLLAIGTSVTHGDAWQARQRAQRATHDIR